MRRGLQNQREHHITLTKYEAVHPTAFRKSCLIRDAYNFDKSQNKLCIDSENVAYLLVDCRDKTEYLVFNVS